MNCKQIHKLVAMVFACGASSIAGSIAAAAPISINTTSFSYSQDFNTLPTSGSVTWSNSTTLAGWSAFQSLPGGTLVAGDRDTPAAGGYNAESSIASNGGSTTTAGLYSFGSPINNTGDRALGAMATSASGDFFYGVEFTNNSGATVDSITIGYRGEQYRGVSAATNSIFVDYSTLGTSFSDNSNFANLAALTFTNPQTPVSGSRTYDGNAAGNFTALSTTVNSLGLAPGATLRIRWYSDSANVDGLSVDDFTFTATASGGAPEPASLGLICLSMIGLRRRRGNR